MQGGVTIEGELSILLVFLTLRFLYTDTSDAVPDATVLHIFKQLEVASCINSMMPSTLLIQQC